MLPALFLPVETNDASLSFQSHLKCLVNISPPMCNCEYFCPRLTPVDQQCPEFALAADFLRVPEVFPVETAPRTVQLSGFRKVHLPAQIRPDQPFHSLVTAPLSSAQKPGLFLLIAGF